MYNNGYQPQAYMPQYQFNKSILKGHPVSSLEEVRATGIDFDGSISYFPDIANKRIYTKQINLDGTASLNMYELTAIPEVPSNSNFITRDEFNAALTQIKNSLRPEPTGETAVPATETTKSTKDFNF